MLPLSSHVFFSHNKQVIELCTSRANQNLCTGGLDFRTWKLEMCKLQISVIWLKQFLTPSLNKSSIWGVAVNNKDKTKRHAAKSLNSTFQVTMVLRLRWFPLSTFNTTTYHLLESLGNVVTLHGGAGLPLLQILVHKPTTCRKVGIIWCYSAGWLVTSQRSLLSSGSG